MRTIQRILFTFIILLFLSVPISTAYSITISPNQINNYVSSVHFQNGATEDELDPIFKEYQPPSSGLIIAIIVIFVIILSGVFLHKRDN